jgi:eukaryotic-like serine/threonine-protein kinase
MTNAPAPHSLAPESLIARVADEFIARQKKGEDPDIEEYAARYPEFAVVLRETLAALQLMRLSGISGSGQTPPDETLGGTLGDFRLIQEVGRGGMGIVYEAEQISLRRRVALKILPFAAAMDPKQLQRFKNEAQAAGHLHHTNIVPVYFVGCERGVHFYAMQFIEGQSLAQVIADLRSQIADLKKAGEPKPKDATSSAAPICNLKSAICNSTQLPLTWACKRPRPWSMRMRWA